MSATQAFLQEHGLTALGTAFGSPIVVKQHPTLPSLYLFKYKQSAGNHFRHQVMREVRGLVLDRSQAWKPVAFPYEKFFNYGEKFAPAAEALDWSSARVCEKADGSLCCLFFYEGQWRLSRIWLSRCTESPLPFVEEWVNF